MGINNFNDFITHLCERAHKAIEEDKKNEIYDAISEIRADFDIYIDNIQNAHYLYSDIQKFSNFKGEIIGNEELINIAVPMLTKFGEMQRYFKSKNEDVSNSLLIDIVIVWFKIVAFQAINVMSDYFKQLSVSPLINNEKIFFLGHITGFNKFLIPALSEKKLERAKLTLQKYQLLIDKIYNFDFESDIGSCVISILEFDEMMCIDESVKEELTSANLGSLIIDIPGFTNKLQVIKNQLLSLNFEDQVRQITDYENKGVVLKKKKKWLI